MGLYRHTIVLLGWGGVAFAFLAIVLGATAIGAKGRTPGICAIAGAVSGGTLVAIFMALAGTGGLLAAITAHDAPESPG